MQRWPPTAEHACSASAPVAPNQGILLGADAGRVLSIVTPAGELVVHPLPRPGSKTVAFGRLASKLYIQSDVPSLVTRGFTTNAALAPYALNVSSIEPSQSLSMPSHFSSLTDPGHSYSQPGSSGSRSA